MSASAIATSVLATTRRPVILFCGSSGMGGMETHVMQLGARLVARGLTVAAICSARDDLTPLRDGLAATGVTVHAIPERDGTPLGAIRRFTSLVRAIRAYPGCVVHMHYGGFGGGELPQLAAWLAGARGVVRTEHVPPVPPISTIGRLRVRLRDRFLARVICVSEQNRDEHLRALRRAPHRCIVVHNGVDIEALAPSIDSSGVREELGFPSDAEIVGTVARLVERRKAIDDFVTMASLVRTARQNVRFVVVGDGPLRPELEAQARSLRVDDVVRFVGERADVARIVAAMSVFVLPSLYEGCQYALLEAMAIGRPVVSTRAGVAPAVVRDGETGRLVPYRDPAAAASAVEGLLGDPARAARIGAAGRDAVVARFSLETMVSALAATYAAAAA